GDAVGTLRRGAARSGARLVPEDGPLPGGGPPPRVPRRAPARPAWRRGVRGSHDAAHRAGMRRPVGLARRHETDAVAAGPAAWLPYHRPSIGEEEIAEVVETLRSGWVTTGAKAKRFEHEFAALLGVPDALAVSSGTAALHLALRVLGVQPGDDVIVPAYTFTATAEAATYLGARPVLADVDPL